jgi:hypothetical protein
LPEIAPEFNFIPEAIRSMTMNKIGNLSYYSSDMGTTTQMVTSPYNNPDNAEIAPICRRTLLFFKNGTLKLSDTSMLNYYLQKLTDPSFDKETSPALLNRSRNTQ